MDPKLGISTQTLVSASGQQKGAKLPQYVAAISVTLGAFALGNVLAWTSPTQGELEGTLGTSDWSWVGALMALGAAVAVIPIGYLIDRIGRKYTMLGLVLPFTAGWALIAWAEDSAPMYMVGRFITGMMGGAFSLTAPVYTSEISEKEIRGTLGSYFQLMVTIGILFVYGLGSVLSVFTLSVVCGVVPLVFGAAFIFMPETPLYYLQKGKKDDAQASLQWFRGRNYDVGAELQEIQTSVDEAAAQRLSITQAFRTTEAKKGLMVAFGLMIFQQLSGVNAVIFYTTDIFRSAGSTLEASTATIIVGVIQAITTFISTLVVDRLGRRILLLISDFVMAICTLLLGVFFYLKDETTDDVSDLGWLPLTSVCLFIVVFSLGYGPIPWMMVGELFAPQIKGFASSFSCVLNWILAFIVTKFYSDLADSFGSYTTFWIFAVISGIGTVFVFFLVPETKGKTLDEIQKELGGSAPATSVANAESPKD
ncbi:facilitated trehalose transporter Tret1-like isoform X2 [Zootermopsis nevadensis]|nr:facilitated trehalose transporter Tret1-like isoform X2 [Zootermopsis nevadensis]XP_021923675.1 facilitated trehalose transporter Tret1-like isoform X2 [Zootermopsis nevadensis]